MSRTSLSRPNDALALGRRRLVALVGSPAHRLGRLGPDGWPSVVNLARRRSAWRSRRFIVIIGRAHGSRGVAGRRDAGRFSLQERLARSPPFAAAPRG